MTREEALKTLKENLCNICSYHGKNMDSCDIGYCDNRAAIRTLEKETKESKDIHLPLYKVGDRIESGTDGNAYKLSMSNGKEFEQQSSEDCVSREKLKKWLDMNFSFGGALRKLELFDRLDKELPSVTPKGVTVTDFADKCRECGKQKKGKWKRHIVDNGFNADWKCTECGYKVKTDFVYFNYCPNCGAEMRGEE